MSETCEDKQSELLTQQLNLTADLSNNMTFKQIVKIVSNQSNYLAACALVQQLLNDTE